MKIRLKISVKTRGGRIFIPGVYDLKSNEVLADLLKDVSDERVFETLYVPAEPVLEEETDEDETEEGSEEESKEGSEEESEEGSEEESEETEEVEEKPKKKKKKKRVI